MKTDDLNISPSWRAIICNYSVRVDIPDTDDAIIVPLMERTFGSLERKHIEDDYAMACNPRWTFLFEGDTFIGFFKTEEDALLCKMMV